MTWAIVFRSRRGRAQSRDVSGYHGAQELCGFLDVARRNPAQGPITLIDADRVDGDHADLRTSQFADQIRYGSDPIVALKQEAALWADEFPPVRSGNALERGWIGGKEV